VFLYACRTIDANALFQFDRTDDDSVASAHVLVDDSDVTFALF